MLDYKKIYDDFYLTNDFEVHDDPVRFEKIASLCRGRVLDIGCGTGTLSKYVNNSYVGIDVSSVAIEKAQKERRANATFFVHDIVKEPLKVGSNFDTIIIAEVLEHIEPGNLNISSIFDYFSNGGRLIVSVPNCNRVPDPTHVREFTIPKLRKMFSKYGDVKFHNWAGQDRRIIMTVDTPIKEHEKLSLVIVAKNEELGLENCIMSAIEIVDDVVVAVDSATTDKTKEVAQMFADTVIDFKWQNDFSWARNNAQKYARYNWVLSLDGHEYIKSVGDLFSEMKKDFDGLWCGLKYEDGMAFRYPRVFKKSCVWKDAVHNLIQCNKLNNQEVLKILHDRQHFQAKDAIKIREQQRNKMILEIMGDRVKKNKKDTRALFYLGVHNQTLKQFKRAIKWFHKYLKHSENIGERWFAVFSLAICYLHLGNKRRALYYAFKTENEIAGRWENPRLVAMVLMNFKRFKKASEFLVESMGEYKPGYAFNPLPYSVSDTWDLLGVCFINMFQPDKAKIAWEQAYKTCLDEKKKGFYKTRLDTISTILSSQ